MAQIVSIDSYPTTACDPARLVNLTGLSILVTGGCGFIGSNLAARFVKNGHRVVVSDWFGRSEKWRNISAISLADIVLPDRLPDLMKK